LRERARAQVALAVSLFPLPLRERARAQVALAVSLFPLPLRERARERGVRSSFLCSKFKTCKRLLFRTYDI